MNCLIIKSSRKRTGIRIQSCESTLIIAVLTDLANCDYLLTTDDRLMKYKSERIEIIDPIEFIKRIGGENDD